MRCFVLSFPCAAENKMRWAQKELQRWIRSVLKITVLQQSVHACWVLTFLQQNKKTALHKFAYEEKTSELESSISGGIKDNGLPETPDAVCEWQGKRVICCSEHSPTDSQVINGKTPDWRTLQHPQHYIKMWLGRVNHRAYVSFPFQK